MNHILRTLLVKNAPHRRGIDAGHHVNHGRVGVDAEGLAVAGVERGFDRVGLAEQKRAVVKESHDQAALHGIKNGGAIFLSHVFLQLHLPKHHLHVEGTARYHEALDPRFGSAERDERDAVYVLIDVNADPLQRSLSLLDVIRHELVFQRHGRRRVFDGAVVHRKQLQHFRRHNRAGGGVQRHGERARRDCGRQQNRHTNLDNVHKPDPLQTGNVK